MERSLVSTAEETSRERIAGRGNPNDAYKLAHWDEYRQRRFVPTGDARDGLLMFDTTAPAPTDYDALLARIVQTPQPPGMMLPPMPV